MTDVGKKASMFLADARAAVRVAKAACESAKEKAALSRAQVSLAKEALGLAEACSRERAEIKAPLERLVTSLYKTVLDEGCVFEYAPVTDDDGRLTGLFPTLTRQGRTAHFKSFGGGAAAIGGLGNRLGAALFTPGTGTVLLDEPLVNVSTASWARFVGFAQDLAEKEDTFQVVCVTHSGTEFPQTFKVSMDNGVSSVTMVRGGQEHK